jgi:tRNA 5-methylaminomethyl-2-thiouridine biosynthesis bifunctional protein
VRSLWRRAWAALAAQIAAASITGAPMPIEASLLDSVDAARFVVREAARRTRGGD